MPGWYDDGSEEEYQMQQAAHKAEKARERELAAASPAARPEQTALPAEEMVKILFPDAFVSLSADMPTPEQAWEDAALRLADRIAACNNYEALKAVLKEIQYCNGGFCPICRGGSISGHGLSCNIGQALTEGK